jgi:Flp pilus assembly protein TadB
MGLLASIVAYLSVVAAIVIGFLMSADALRQHSHQLAADARSEIITAAKTDSLKTKNAAKPSRNTAEQRTIPQRSMAAEYRRKAELSNTRVREPHKRTVHEARRGHWPPSREFAPAPRALGYAEEPRFSGDPWRY